MYLLMIEGHIISIELEGSVFNDLTQFNTNAHFLQWKCVDKIKCFKCMV
jgi:hypothetical protein